MRKVGRERGGPSGVIKCPLIGYGPKRGSSNGGFKIRPCREFRLSVEEDSLTGWANPLPAGTVHVTQNGQVVEWPQSRLN